MSDTLALFLDWFLHQNVIGRVPFGSAVHSVEGVTSILMYREAPFQVQMFAVPPNHIIPQHTHPNVDSFEVYVGGEIRFSHKGKWVSEQPKAVDGLPDLRGSIIRVLPNDPHGGVFGPSGGVFFSVQHWLNGVPPSCVANDYSGVVMGADHMAKVERGAPILKHKLTWRDAAPLENDGGV
jgi:quercetin dioxygenase-like cupin family protein